MYELVVLLVGSLIFTTLLSVMLASLEILANPDDRRYLHRAVRELYNEIRLLITQGGSVWRNIRGFYKHHRTLLGILALIFMIVVLLYLLYLVQDRAPAKSISSPIQFYGVTWSKESVNVGGEVTVSGRFYVFPWHRKQWPYVVNLLAQGSNNEFSTVRTSVGGEPVATAMRVAPKKNYEFNIVMKAEKAGRSTLSPMMEVGRDRVMGPGKPISIEEDPIGESRLSEDIKKVLVWAVLIIGMGSIGFVLLRPQNYKRPISQGALGLAIITMSAVLLYVANTGNYAIPITLRAGVIGEPSEEHLESSGPIEVTVDDVVHREAERTTTMKITLQNRGIEPVSIDMYESGGKRFLSDAVSEEEGYPEKFVVPQGLSVDNKTPMKPGESRKIVMSVTDKMPNATDKSEDTYASYDQLGGLLFIKDEKGVRYMAPIDGFIDSMGEATIEWWNKINAFVISKDTRN